MADRCTGRCCRDFIIRRSPKELRRDADEATPRWKAEYTKIADMVVHLRATGRFGDEHHYTCKHFDSETNNCTDYENRPEMCRNYPYGDPCGFEECEWNPDSPKPDVSVKKLRYSAYRYRLGMAETRAAVDQLETQLGELNAKLELAVQEAPIEQRPRCDGRGRIRAGK